MFMLQGFSNELFNSANFLFLVDGIFVGALAFFPHTLTININKTINNKFYYSKTVYYVQFEQVYAANYLFKPVSNA